MLTKRPLMLLGTLVVMGLLLTACAAAAGKAEPTATPAESPLQTPTLAPTLTLTPTETSTPTPTPTETSTPTPTPTPTMTPRPIAPPAIRITYPAFGTQVTAGQQIAIQSVATAGAGVARIVLWADGTLYSSTPNPRPGSVVMSASQVWSSTALGEHTLVVLAYDTLGRVSAPVSLTLTVVSSPAKPMVWIAQPYAPSGRIVVQQDDNVTLDYWATDAAGVTRMELWADGQLYASDDNPNDTTVMRVQHTWSSDALGDHTLFVRAYDTLGQSSDSAQLIIGVADRNPPDVSIDSPADGAQFPAGQLVPVVITAGDSKGITRLELWVDNLIYTVWNSSVPQGETPVHLTLAWQQPTAGSHTLYVRASDSVGLSSQTPSITVNIVTPPQPTPSRLPGPSLVVNPVTSPTDLVHQTITGQTDHNVNVTVVSEAGRFYERSSADGTFAITIDLVPGIVNHILVTAAYDNPAAAVTETQTDINGNPLNIVQVPAPTPVPPTPTPVPPTPTPTPTSTPVPPTPTPTPVPPTPTPVPPTPTSTPVPPTPTSTPVPPTLTPTPVPPTPTPVPPTFTPTPVPPTPTFTPIPPTPTPTLVPPKPTRRPRRRGVR